MDFTHTDEQNNRSHTTHHVTMILAGIIFLLGMSDITIFGQSLWLLMGLLPVYWILSNAYELYQIDGHLSNRVLATLLTCLLPFVFVIAVIFGVIGRVWPIALIVTGTAAIISRRK